MLARCSVIARRAFSKDQITSRWKRTDPNRYWRAQHNLPEDDAEHGPLAELPDYSYLNGEPSHFSTQQRKKYDFNAGVVRRIHELDAELNEAKRLYAEKISSAMADYNKTADIANRMKTPDAPTKSSARRADPQPRASLSSPNEYSLQPNLLNALREKATYNEAFEEVVDPVGDIVPNKLMSIERPPYKRTGERRRFHKVFTNRTPRLRLFPR